jgi:hypothetical protein
MTRLPDSELEAYENAIANQVDIRGRVKRLMYAIDEPDLLDDLAAIMAASARTQQLIHQLLAVRRAEIQARKSKEPPDGEIGGS